MRNFYKRGALALPVLLVVWAGAALASAPAADASPNAGTLFVQGGELVFQAGTGTVNDVVLHTGGSLIQFRDTDAPVALDPARAGTCTQVDAHTVECDPFVLKVRADLQDGNDFFHGDGNAVVFGGDGDDRIDAGPVLAANTFHGGAGKDTITGGLGRDVIHAGPGDDTVEGLAGNDVLLGNAGKDEIHGDGGDDRIDGGADRDNVYGDDGKDDLRSTHADDNQYGGAGNDTLGSGIDVLGEAGDDRVVMGKNGGEYWGGQGNDVIDYSAWGHEVHVSLDGNDNDGGKNADCDDWIGCPVTERHNVHGDFEHVIGTPHDDKISGNNNPENLDGGAGSDRLYGNGGNDYLDAETGTNQRTDGGTGFDTCVGFGIVARPGCDA